MTTPERLAAYEALVREWEEFQSCEVGNPRELAAIEKDLDDARAKCLEPVDLVEGGASYWKARALEAQEKLTASETQLRRTKAKLDALLEFVPDGAIQPFGRSLRWVREALKEKIESGVKQAQERRQSKG